MIAVLVAVLLMFMLLSCFLEEKFAKSIVMLSCLGTLLAYFFIVGGRPFDGIFEENLKWLKVMNMDMGIGFAANPVNSLILMALLFVILFFAPLYLKNFQEIEIKKHMRLLMLTVLFLIVGVMSTGIITFFISWLALGAIGFVESRKRLDGKKKNYKFFYVGMDGTLMFFGLLLLSLMFSSTSFDVINEKFGEVIQEEKDIVYVGFLFLSLAVFIRSFIFPFLFNYRDGVAGDKTSFHVFEFLTRVPLGYVLILKISQAMNAYFFSNIFFVLGIATFFIMLLSALMKNDAIEILNLENGSMVGMVYALLGLGQISTSVIIFVTFLLLKSSINMLFLTIPDKKSSKKIFFPMVLLMGAYIGLPGLTNFFLFFDAALAFQSQGASFYIFIFMLLNGILHVKLLSLIFDFKEMFSSHATREQMGIQSVMVLFPGLLSWLMVLYCIPPNLSSGNAQIMKEKISPHLADKAVSIGSVQEQNIVMILLFASIILSVLLGGYFYIFKEKSRFLETIKKYFFWINEFANQEQSSKKSSQTSSFQKEYIWKYCPNIHLFEKFKMMNIYTEKIMAPLREARVETINVSLIQMFAMIIFCLLLFLLGMGWEKFI